MPQVSVVVRSMGRPTLDAALASIAAQQDCTVEVVVVAACGPGHSPLPATLRRARAAPRRQPRAAAASRGRQRRPRCGDRRLDHLPRRRRRLPARPPRGPARRRRRRAGRARRHFVRARACSATAHVEWFGQPFSLSQLYERNFIHLSAAIFARELVAAGCRFDESLEILEDWEFMLQLAQRAAFHFVPLGSFQWNADAGDSGAAGGANHDAAKFAAHRDRVYAKWAAAHDALVERVAPKLEAAAARIAGARLRRRRGAVPRRARGQRQRPVGAQPAGDGAARTADGSPRRARRRSSRSPCGRRTRRSSTIWRCSRVRRATSTRPGATRSAPPRWRRRSPRRSRWPGLPATAAPRDAAAARRVAPPIRFPLHRAPCQLCFRTPLPASAHPAPTLRP